MTKINLEKFEQEYLGEINAIKSLQFQSVNKNEFVFPAYSFSRIENKTSVYWGRRAVGIAFAMPAFAFLFAFFFYTVPVDGNLAMIEDSNTRILNEISSLDTQ